MVSHRLRRTRAIGLALCLAVLPAPARAEAPDAVAQREYQLGYQALQAGDCVRALGHYQRSYALAPRPRTLFNMAACQETLQLDADAWRSYHAFLAQAEARDAEIAVKARARIEALRQRLTGRLAVDSTPPGAAVQLDGERQARGVTPLTLTLAPGPHRVRLARAGAIPAERTVEITPEAVSSLSVDLALPSAISIRVEPADALIVPAEGGAPARGRLELPVSPGHYAFTIRRPGYRSEQIAIDAVASRTYEQRVILQPDARATLVIEGAAGGAVTLDGRAAPTAGVLAMRDIATGAHAVRVERPGRSPWSADLHLAAGETVTVAVDLAPRHRALAWTAGGVGLAALAAGSVVGVFALRDVTSPVAGDHDRGKSRALVADGMFAVSAVAFVAAWRLARGRASTATIRRAVAP